MSLKPTAKQLVTLCRQREFSFPVTALPARLTHVLPLKVKAEVFYTEISMKVS